MGTSTLDDFQTLPSAIITDGLLPVPLFCVTRMSLSENYHLPPIGSTGFRAAVDNSDDSITMNALLVGTQRYAWKLSLELLADLSRRGSAITRYTSGAVGGLILITGMTFRLDMQITNLTFNVTAQRRQAIEVNIAMQHVPRPGVQNLLLDAGMTAVMTTVDFFR